MPRGGFWPVRSAEVILFAELQIPVRNSGTTGGVNTAEVVPAAEFLRGNERRRSSRARKTGHILSILSGGNRNGDCKNVTQQLLNLSYRQYSPERSWSPMDIRFVSSLTSEDERLFAPALLKAVAAILDQLPIAYTVRIETTGADVFQHAHAVPLDDVAKGDAFESSGGNGKALNHYLGRLAHS